MKGCCVMQEPEMGTKLLDMLNTAGCPSIMIQFLIVSFEGAQSDRKCAGDMKLGCRSIRRILNKLNNLEGFLRYPVILFVKTKKRKKN